MTDAKLGRRRRNWPWILLGLFAVATVCKALLNATFDNFKMLEEHESFSPADARAKGTLVCELEPDGPLPTVRGQPLDFRDAWVEDRHLECHHLIWFPGVRRLGGQNVCILVGSGQERKFVAAEPLTSGGSWTSDGQSLFLFRVEHWEGRTSSLGVTDGWFQQPVAGELRLKPRVK